MIDTDMAEQILQGDDTHPDIPCHNSRLQALGLEMLAEVKRLRYHLDLMIEKFGEAYLIETLIERGEEE